LKNIVILLIALSIISNPVKAQKAITAVKVANPPVINGHMDEAVWQQAVIVNEFYQREPKEGAPVSERTEFFICYDSHNLYMGFKCWDDPEKITAKEMARDVSLGNDDRVQVILDTYLDHRNAYWFQIGPRGSIGDAIVSENGAILNKQWDGLWEGKARITDWGWEAEIAIPFKTLGFDKNSSQWGMKLIRNIVNKLETDYWPVANVNSAKFQVSDSGILDGLEGITQGIGLDISPYLVTGMNTKKGTDTDYKLTGGVDLFYQITPSLKSSLTVNTDFAETEVDDRQINLTRFNLLYPEKRDFFLDGANYFQFGLQSDDSPVANRIIPFFSRRMGLDLSGKPIPIQYGGKLTGQIDSWNLGMMYMKDDREDGISSFTATRVSKNIGGQSSVGLIGTYGNALNDNRNMVAGFDVKLISSTFHKNKNIGLILFGLKSDTKNLNSDDKSWGAQFMYPNDFLNIYAGHLEIEKNFVAGMGFVPRTNIKESYAEVQIGPRPKKGPVLQVHTGAEIDYIRTFENILETREIHLNPLSIRFRSGEVIEYSLKNQYEYLERDFNIFEDYIIPKGKFQWWTNIFSLTTKGSRNLWGTAGYNFGDFYNGKRNDLTLGANWKISVPFFVGGKFTRNHIDLPEGDFSALIYQVNANILFSPDITLYSYFQYDNASNSLGWQSRFQWIVKPGNEIILAWTSGFKKPQSRFILDESALRLKLKYNIRF
jgi:hypothetical protein